MIPKTYNEWRECIVNDCGIALTVEFAQSRVSILKDSNHPETQKFKKLYGDEHLKNTLSWFSHVANS